MPACQRHTAALAAQAGAEDGQEIGAEPDRTDAVRARAMCIAPHSLLI